MTFIKRTIRPLRAWITANSSTAKFAEAMGITATTAHSWCSKSGVPDHRIDDVKAHTGLTRQQLFRADGTVKKECKPEPLTWGSHWRE